MGNIGDPITPSVPAVGSAGPQFATDINAILTELVARLSARVPLSSINTNSTLNMTGSPIINAGYLTLADVLATPGASPVNRLTAFGGNLFYVGPSGPIQLTVGTQLNAAAIGGITGDYSSAGPMQFRYTTATTRYDAYANFSTNAWAYQRALGFDIAAGATSAVFARLLFGGSVNKTYTLPSAAATSQQMPLYMDNTGQITVGCGSRNLSFPAVGMVPINGGSNTLICNNPFAGDLRLGTRTNTAGSDTAYKALDNIPIGYAFTSINVYFTKTNADTVTINLYKQVNGGLASLLASNTSTAVGAVTLALTPGATEVSTSGAVYAVRVFFGAGTANATTVHTFEVVGSYPA